MAIIKFIPRKVKAIDRRNDQGGYYEMSCDSCGQVFYPKRSNAKYCSEMCAHREYLKKIRASGIKKEKPVVTPEDEKKTFPGERIPYRIRGKVRVRLTRTEYNRLRNLGKALKIGQTFTHEDDEDIITIKKVGEDAFIIASCVKKPKQ